MEFSPILVAQSGRLGWWRKVGKVQNNRYTDENKDVAGPGHISQVWKVLHIYTTFFGLVPLRDSGLLRDSGFSGKHPFRRATFGSWALHMCLVL